MSKLRAIFILSILIVAVAFFDGFSSAFESNFIIVSSLSIAILSYMLRIETRLYKSPDDGDSFIQNSHSSMQEVRPKTDIHHDSSAQNSK